MTPVAIENNRWFCFLVFLLISAILASGCSVFRGVPSHGGGKRFDEEQRIVAASMREALREMDLMQLRDKRVHVVITHMTTMGSGNPTWGGLQDIGFNLNRNKIDSDYMRYDPSHWSYNLDTLENRNAFTFRYRPYMGFYTSNVNTDPDMTYFAALLEMKLRHIGAVPVRDKPDITLYLLIDAMGTNRSRIDYILAGRDLYRATCEISYYAEASETGELLIQETNAAGEATYDEFSMLFFGFNKVRRSSDVLEPPFQLSLKHANHKDRLMEIEHTISQSVRNGKSPPPDLKKEYMELLGARARMLLESGHPLDVKDAADLIHRMRAMDPNHPVLRDIESRYRDKLDP